MSVWETVGGKTCFLHPSPGLQLIELSDLVLLLDNELRMQSDRDSEQILFFTLLFVFCWPFFTSQETTLSGYTVFISHLVQMYLNSSWLQFLTFHNCVVNKPMNYCHGQTLDHPLLPPLQDGILVGAVGAYDWNGGVLKETRQGKVVPPKSSYSLEFPEELKNHGAYLGA